MILNRPRHEELIARVREAGARVKLIRDGDVAAVIAATMPETGVDAYMGIGGAPEGVLAAAALRATGGQMCGKLLFKNDEQKQRAEAMGIKDLSKQYFLQDLAKGDVAFIATGVTNGYLLKGVSHYENHISTHSIVMDSKTGAIMKIESHLPRS
jgi:fructose-1,6-bisphosphatase II / sedoheptulose-1,7-bisphosphatase